MGHLFSILTRGRHYWQKSKREILSTSIAVTLEETEETIERGKHLDDNG